MEANNNHIRIKNAYSKQQTNLSQTFNNRLQRQRPIEQEENNMSEEVKKGTPITWDDVQLDGNYVKFEEGKRTKLLIHKFGPVEKEGTNYNTKEPETQIFFDAEVLNQDGKACVKTLSTSSKPFLKAIKPFVEDKDPKVPIHLSIKKLGDGKTTTYDIELVE